MGMIFYRSNNGVGPFIGKVISETADKITLEYWKETDGTCKHNPRVIFADLPKDFFYSNSCGWKLDRMTTPAEKRGG